MPPLDAHPLMVDLDRPPILVERFFPAGTRDVPPEFIGAARVIVMGAAAARQIRERRQRIEEGARLRSARLAARLSTKQAADRLGISRVRLWRWETGRERAAEAAVERMEGRG